MTVLYLNLCYNEGGYKGTALYLSFHEDDRSACWHQLINLFNPYKPSIFFVGHVYANSADPDQDLQCLLTVHTTGASPVFTVCHKVISV